jgi:hypothetical protein
MQVFDRLLYELGVGVALKGHNFSRAANAGQKATGLYRLLKNAAL